MNRSCATRGNKNFCKYFSLESSPGEFPCATCFYAPCSTRNYDFIKVKTFLIKKNFVFLYSYFFYYFFVYDFSFHSVLDGGENFWFATPVLADLNSDNKLDILVGNIYGDLRLYYQDQDYNFLLEYISYNNINVGYYSAPFFFDIDSDYDLDLVVGGQTRHRLYENIDNNFIEINSDIIPYMGKNAKFTGANLYSSDKFNLISGISTGGVYIASKSTCLRGDLDNNDMINVLDITALVYLILDINLYFYKVHL